MKPGPCYNCKDRVFGCYHTCEAYQTWRAEWDDLQEKKRAANKTRDMIDNYVLERNNRWKKGRGKK